MTDKYDKEKRFIPEDGGSGGTGGNKDLPMETKNYIPYIIAGIGLVIAMLIILL